MIDSNTNYYFTRGGTTLGLKGAMPPPPLKIPLEKNPLIYILPQKIYFFSKINILAPLPSQKIYKLTHKIPKMKKFIKSSIVWLSQEYQEKPLAKTFGQFTNIDNKKNLENKSHI